MNRRELIITMAGVGATAMLGGCAGVPIRTRNPGGDPLRGPTSRFFTVDGTRLHYLDWGNDGAVPLILLHAAPLNARAWDSFAAGMASAYHVIAPDARGFGESQWASSYETDIFVNDVNALVRSLGGKRVILCGNSMGATVAMAYASSHPDLLERLVLVDTGPGPRPSADARPAAPSGGRPGPPPLPPGPFSSRDEATSQLTALAGPEFARIVTHENLRQDSAGSWHWKFDHRGTAGGFERSMRDPRRWSRWLAIRCPTLVVRGGRSPALSQTAAEEMVRANTNATLVVIPDAGHFVAAEQPAAFERAVRDWLRS